MAENTAYSKNEPSIHIGRSNLTILVEKLIKQGVITIHVSKENLVGQILKYASPYSLSNRAVVASNKKIEEKVEKITVTTKDTAVLFSSMLFKVRRQFKHRGINLITSTSKEWATLKQVASNAEDFVEDFDIPIREGFIEYCTIGIKLMKVYSLNKFLPLHTRICTEYEAKQAEKEDKHKDITDTLCKIYNKAVLDETGIVDDISKKPESKVWFVKAAEYIADSKIKPEVYMRAQFEGLSFTGNIPYPSQFVGDKAVERLYRYMKKNNVKAQKPKSMSWLNLGKLKSIEDGTEE